MIIPIRCFTCNQVIADKWNSYQKSVQEEYIKQDIHSKKKNRFVNINELEKDIC